MGIRPERQSSLIWRKSSLSATQGDCVEIASSAENVLVRDSRDRPGPVLVLSLGQWRGFLCHIQDRNLDFG